MMRDLKPTSKTGLTLIELLIALVIFGFAIAGVYRVFVVQSRAYTVQEQVVEVQQNIRSAMEILLRDIRMAGYDNDSPSSKVAVSNPIQSGDGTKTNPIVVEYEYDDTTRYSVAYWVEGSPLTLKRQLTQIKDDGSNTTQTQDLLENVEGFNLSYGVDIDDDGAKDNYNGEEWVSAATVQANGLKVVAVRAILTVNPDQTNTDVKKWVSPRTLTSIVALRNQTFAK